MPRDTSPNTNRYTNTDAVSDDDTSPNANSDGNTDNFPYDGLQKHWWHVQFSEL